MIMKKTLSLLLAVIMIAMTFTVFPITANAATVDTAGTAESEVIDVGTANELKAACTKINTNGGNYTINITADIETGYISVTNPNAVVTVVGNGHTITGNSIVADVENGAVLNLGDNNSALILRAGRTNDESGIVYVGISGVCNMYDRVTVKDHITENHYGAGVTVYGGTFHMHGGSVENCGVQTGTVSYGAGVCVYNSGSFIMDNGTIKNCFVHSSDGNELIGNGGGVCVLGNSTFVMNGGVIENNAALNGGGIAIMTGRNNNYPYFAGRVTINGGTIRNNTANNGGGIYAAGNIYMWSTTGSVDEPGLSIRNAAVTHNRAASVGGGIYFYGNSLSGSFLGEVKNSEISDNNAIAGGGVAVVAFSSTVDIDNCTVKDNTCTYNGGGIYVYGSSSKSSSVILKDTAITGNTTTDSIGAGVFYNAYATLSVSGADTIQNNQFNGAENNLNVLSKDNPVRVIGALTGSQIGLSDPKLWDDDLSDESDEAVSEDYLTSGYKNYNTANPSAYFTSDHETWMADFSNVKEDEVRLVRKTKIDYHINNADIAAAKYNDNDIFTSYVETATGKEIAFGDTINKFYTIPEVVPTDTNSCPYIFKGWYYDQDNEDDDDPVVFGTDVYTARRDIYAHWIKVENVRKHWSDENVLPPDVKSYGGFDLAGVQIRRSMLDTNFGEITPGGMRFITSLSMDVVNEINKIKPNNIEYGYVATTNTDWINYHDGYEKLQYVSKTANGIDTSETAENENYFGFAENIDCTSAVAEGRTTVVPLDHQNYDGYLLYSLVINYDEENPTGYDTKVLARPYIHYTDANGSERVAYSEYRGTNTLGGCYISYNDIAAPSGN